MELIKAKVEKKYYWQFKILMLIIAAPFLYDLYVIISTEVAISGKFTFVKGEHRGYYSELFKNLTISILFLWLGLFGTKVKSVNDKNNK